MKEVFSIDEAANYLGVSKRTVEEYIIKGMLHTYRLPSPRIEGEYLRRTMIHISDLQKLIKRGMSV